jgi:hypothetical protein
MRWRTSWLEAYPSFWIGRIGLAGRCPAGRSGQRRKNEKVSISVEDCSIFKERGGRLERWATSVQFEASPAWSGVEGLRKRLKAEGDEIFPMCGTGPGTGSIKWASPPKSCYARLDSLSRIITSANVTLL